MDFWQRAVVFADGAAKRSKELSMEAAKRSQELTKGASKFSQEFVAETAKKSKELAAETAKKSKELAVEASKKSKELAAEAKKRADEIRVEALKRTDQIKSLARDIPISLPPLAQGSVEAAPEAAGRSSSELERFGVTDELREFVEGITISTFRDFPMEDTDEPQIMDVPNASNIRQDLNEWQAQHATLVLSTVKEISKYRYELCPRYMKERKFWHIYFILVNNYVSPYEKQYMESKLKPTQHDENPNDFEANVLDSKSGEEERKLQSKTSTSDHDLDEFLLGDRSSDEGPDDGSGPDGGLDDDLDEIRGQYGLDSQDHE